MVRVSSDWINIIVVATEIYLVFVGERNNQEFRVVEVSGGVIPPIREVRAHRDTNIQNVSGRQPLFGIIYELLCVRKWGFTRVIPDRGIARDSVWLRSFKLVGGRNGSIEMGVISKLLHIHASIDGKCRIGIKATGVVRERRTELVLGVGEIPLGVIEMLDILGQLVVSSRP